MYLLKKLKILIFSFVAIPLNGYCDRIFPATLLQNWGYRELKSSHYMEKFCSGIEMPDSVTLQHLRSIVKSATIKDAYYRFTVGKEEFNSETSAQKRVKEINSPGQRSTKASKMCDIRKAMQYNKTVYFIHTDVGAFRDELDRLFKLLNDIDLAEQTKTASDAKLESTFPIE